MSPFHSSPSLPSTWGVKSLLMSTFSFLLPMASSLRRYAVPEQEQWLFNESVFLFFLMPRTIFLRTTLIPPPIRNLLSVLTDDWNVLSLGSDSKSKIPSPTSYRLTLSVYIPRSSHTAQLFPRHTVLFSLPKYCSHCSSASLLLSTLLFLWWLL